MPSSKLFCMEELLHRDELRRGQEVGGIKQWFIYMGRQTCLKTKAQDTPSAVHVKLQHAAASFSEHWCMSTLHHSGITCQASSSCPNQPIRWSCKRHKLSFRGWESQHKAQPLRCSCKGGSEYIILHRKLSYIEWHGCGQHGQLAEYTHALFLAHTLNKACLRRRFPSDVIGKLLGKNRDADSCRNAEFASISVYMLTQWNVI